jgi:hypothetical protein
MALRDLFAARPIIQKQQDVRPSRNTIGNGPAARTVIVGGDIRRNARVASHFRRAWLMGIWPCSWEGKDKAIRKRPIGPMKQS